MAISDLSILNAALVLIGLKKADSVAEDRKAVRVYDAIYEQAKNEMFDLPYDWKFATARSQLYKLYQITVDNSPAPAVWSAGATLTGATSGTTCTIVSKVSSTIYLTTEPLDSDGESADFTDGEVISDGTNSRDCGTGYPVVVEKTPDFGYNHQYRMPANFRRIIAQVDSDGDDTEYEYRRELYVDAASNEMDVFLTNEDTVYVKYVRLRTDVSTWPAWFARLVYLNLAILLCEPLKQKTPKQNQLILMFDKALKMAVNSNGLEDVNTSDDNIDADRGNTSVVDAASDDDVDTKYIVNRSS